MNIEDIIPGSSYACMYKDLNGVDCLAVIHTRDTTQRMVEIEDTNTGLMMTMSYDDVHSVDTVEYKADL